MGHRDRRGLPKLPPFQPSASCPCSPARMVQCLVWQTPENRVSCRQATHQEPGIEHQTWPACLCRKIFAGLMQARRGKAGAACNEGGRNFMRVTLRQWPENTTSTMKRPRESTPSSCDSPFCCNAPALAATRRDSAGPAAPWFPQGHQQATTPDPDDKGLVVHPHRPCRLAPPSSRSPATRTRRGSNWCQWPLRSWAWWTKIGPFFRVQGLEYPPSRINSTSPHRPCSFGPGS